MNENLDSILPDSYEFYAGCEKGKSCTTGKSCLASDECTDCSFGTCLQHANLKLVEGFSYSLSQVCRLCTKEQLSSLKTLPNWSVYKKKG